MHSKLTRIAAALVAVVTLSTGPAWALELPCCEPSRTTRCREYHGEAYIVCAEAWNNGRFHWGAHPGPSSASGPWGMLSSTTRRWGTAERYMLNRYGSWTAAERAHRRKGWW